MMELANSTLAATDVRHEAHFPSQTSEPSIASYASKPLRTELRSNAGEISRDLADMNVCSLLTRLQEVGKLPSDTCQSKATDSSF